MRSEGKFVEVDGMKESMNVQMNIRKIKKKDGENKGIRMRKGKNLYNEE